MKTIPYGIFWEKIHHAAKDRHFPLRVMFELTYRCNFQCPHCYIPASYKNNSAKKELNTKQIFSILDELKELGCFYLGFTGGEPFVRKDILDILWHAKKKGFEIIIYTNGSLIDDKMAEELARLRPNKIDITIPAMDENAFDNITATSRYRNRVFGAIDFLHKRKVALGFKTCVLKGNEGQIKDIQRFSTSLGALHRLDEILSPCLDGSETPYRYRGKVKSRTSGHRLSQKPDCQTLQTQYRSRESIVLFKCGSGINQAAITPSGELKMCLMINYPRYNILDASLKNSWEKLKKIAGNIKPDENYNCDKCNLAPYCKWCPARGWLKHGSFSRCEPQSRYWAKQTKKLISG